MRSKVTSLAAIISFCAEKTDLAFYAALIAG
jgi:hypothetical protein